MNLAKFLVALFGLLVLSVPAAGQDGDERYDIVILGGRVIDPETGLDAVRNVGIRGSEIAIVTDQPIQGERVIDASGQVVAPGFIDMHAHGQRILAGRVQALDGVTTALDLEQGMLPVSQYYDQSAAEGRPINYGASVNWANARIAVKTGVEPEPSLQFFLESFGDLRWQEELADEAELAEITRLVQQGLDEGGIGIGFLLGYAPGTGRKEYYELNLLAAQNGVPTYTHARHLSAIEPDSSFEAFQEMIAVAASSGAQMHIAHFNSISIRDIEATAEIVSQAQASGLPISLEAYPYGAGASGIGAAMFRGDNWQERLGGVLKSDFSVSGEALSDEEFDRLQAEAPGTEIVVRFLNPAERARDQEYLDISALYPGGVIASDGIMWSDREGQLLDQHTWPLPEDAVSHPRSAGTYSKFLRVYVRERHAISLLEAIAKLSFYPAQILQGSVPQMERKGRIQVGADADIVVFDLERVSDRATFEQPAQTSVGFNWVIVAGTPVVEEGEINTDVLPGQPVRRPIVSETQQ